MNVNVKLSLDDDQRRRLASYIAGKPVKRLATRGDVNAIVQELLQSALKGRSPAPRDHDPYDDLVASGGLPEAQPPVTACSDECCLQNRLLLDRVNVLQGKLDSLR